jgi:hypothetical protein
MDTVTVPIGLAILGVVLQVHPPYRPIKSLMHYTYPPSSPIKDLLSWCCCRYSR